MEFVNVREKHMNEQMSVINRKNRKTLIRTFTPQCCLTDGFTVEYCWFTVSNERNWEILILFVLISVNISNMWYLTKILQLIIVTEQTVLYIVLFCLEVLACTVHSSKWKAIVFLTGIKWNETQFPQYFFLFTAL